MADIHVGGLITKLLGEQHRTKRDLGVDVGMSQSNIVYLTTRASIDVKTLHQIGIKLKYNFWKHFPIDDGSAKQTSPVGDGKPVVVEKDKEIAELNTKVLEQEKLIDELKRELVKQENGFLKEINGLLKRK